MYLLKKDIRNVTGKIQLNSNYEIAKGKGEPDRTQQMVSKDPLSIGN